MNPLNSKIDLSLSFNKLKTIIMANIFNPTTDDLGKSYGYLACLRDLQTYLVKTTQYKPENRYVDSVPILEDLAIATGELGKYFDTVKETNDLPPGVFEMPGI